MNYKMKVMLTCAVKFLSVPLTYIYNEDNENISEVIAEQVLKDNQIPRIEGYVEHIIPSLSAMQFKAHFRMLPSTFECTLEEIGEKLIRTTEGNQMISAEKQLLLSLWRFATLDSYRSIIERFNVGKATATVRTVRRVAKALCELSPRYIVWPTNDKIQDIVLGFSRKNGFPDTIGAIGGTHITIPAPNENAEAYINRKGHHSIHLQDVFKIGGKLLASCYSKLSYREGIKLPTNKDSVATILVTHIINAYLTSNNMPIRDPEYIIEAKRRKMTEKQKE